ncbi:MAG: 50S ribosomal protein L24 [Crocinitomicaceae bacterium]|nr:50S ribosomal protein L24 [Crocinitomicaceae bacterium]|tara:strand:- start:1560 stop:1877 length:318 start_codon:yes stop_codon:yes gene_type:complete
MNKKFHIKVGDTVKVIAGNEKNNTGRVLEILKTKDRAIVEGLNIVKVHRKPSAENPQGGIEEKEAGIHISNLMIVDAKGNATRIGRRKGENGKSVRYSKKSGEEL